MKQIVTIQASTPITATLADLVTITGGLIALAIVIWQFRLYRQLTENQKAIVAKQVEIDAVPDKQLAIAQQNTIAQPTLNKMIEKAQAPLRHELAKLERERKFILDKRLFASK